MKTIVELRGIEFTCEYDYSAGDGGVWQDWSGEGYPATPPSVSFKSIKFKGEEFFEFLNEADVDELEQLIINEHE